MSFSENPIFLDTVIHGKFFFPAWKHYGNPSTDVRCDRCFKTNLVCCIGYGDKDLCLDCTEIICNKNKHIHPHHPHGPILPPPPFNPDPIFPYITRMEQGMFRK